METVAGVLARMTGLRERCMYCHDSRATDIDHFWPLSAYAARAFQWENMLWTCTGCNRPKSEKFALDAVGTPLLINPTAEDPWDFIVYDADTDLLTARYREDGTPDPKGDYTTDEDRSGLPLNIEAVTNGRKRTRRALVRAVREYLANAIPGADPARARQLLDEAITDHDDYGLVEWFFLKDGQDDEPFAELKRSHRGVFDEIGAAIETRTP
jgi:uncharacterized protein (TIGR02646 family)